MDPEKQKLLRAPFPPERISSIPKKTKSGATIKLDYVGHADVTDRLLTVDPGWTWEPAAVDEFGQPQINRDGLWIKLTVCGVTRYGFGDAQGKSGGDAVKEMIGDAIRNAAMRFGVALDLWSKSDPDAPTFMEPEVVTDPEWLNDAVKGISEAKTTADLETVRDYILAGRAAGKCSESDADSLRAQYVAAEKGIG